MKSAEATSSGPSTGPGDETTSARPLAPDAIDHETRDRLFRLAYRFLWNRHDADDAVQSALAAAIEKGGDLRDRGKSWSWLCSIVVQRCRLLRRRATRWTFHWNAYARDVREDAPPDTSASATDAVRSLMQRLPRRQYEVLVLRELQAMSYDEIAVVLRISASTARVHAQAAREALRKLVLKNHPDLLDAESSDRP